VSATRDAKAAEGVVFKYDPHCPRCVAKKEAHPERAYEELCHFRCPHRRLARRGH
jgi:hypothetical protein